MHSSIFRLRKWILEFNVDSAMMSLLVVLRPIIDNPTSNKDLLTPYPFPGERQWWWWWWEGCEWLREETSPPQLQTPRQSHLTFLGRHFCPNDGRTAPPQRGQTAQDGRGERTSWCPSCHAIAGSPEPADVLGVASRPRSCLLPLRQDLWLEAQPVSPLADPHRRETSSVPALWIQRIPPFACPHSHQQSPSAPGPNPRETQLVFGIHKCFSLYISTNII